jgi:hypothetical protein
MVIVVYHQSSYDISDDSDAVSCHLDIKTNIMDPAPESLYFVGKSRYSML